MFFKAVFDFPFRNVIPDGDDWFSYYTSQASFSTISITNYIKAVLEKYQRSDNFLSLSYKVLQELPQSSVVSFDKEMFRISPIEHFFSTVIEAYKTNLKTSVKIRNLSEQIPKAINESKELKQMIVGEYNKTQRKALTNLLNNTREPFDGKLILDSITYNMYVRYTETIIAKIDDGVLFISRQNPIFELGNLIFFLKTNNWCSIKNCRINEGIICISPNAVLNCDGLEIVNKIKFITYKSTKKFLINLDPELEKKGKVEFIYLDNENTKKFLKTQGWPVFPEPTKEEANKIMTKQRNIAENYDINKYIVGKKKVKMSKQTKKTRDKGIDAELYGKLVELYTKRYRKDPNYDDVSKFYNRVLTEFEKDSKNCININMYLDKFLKK